MTDGFREHMLSLFGGEYEIYDGVVSAVSEENMIIDIEMDEGVIMPDVMLRSVSDGGKAGFVCIPETGSEVVFAKVRGMNDFVLLKTSALAKVVFEVGSIKMEITPDGFVIGSGSDSLQSILADFMTEVTKIVVTQGTSPNVPAIEAIKDRLNSILK